MPHSAPFELPLYPVQVPNSYPARDEETITYKNGTLFVNRISHPTLTVFLPDPGLANGTAVIICPGGGYLGVARDKEGTEVAEKLNDLGMAAMVLKYRTPDQATMVNRELSPLQDGQAALHLVRAKASFWQIDPHRIGMMGFSAGGHLAGLTGTRFGQRTIDPDDGISLRPDFLMLIYPVISLMDPIAHQGCREQLIGLEPTLEKIREYSLELQVSSSTPPSFLVHAGDDLSVHPENSLRFYEALRKKQIPAELHLYQEGGHGFGLELKNKEECWLVRCKNWMEVNGWLKNSAG
ncbi:MAG: alpha/beta hydrolase [Chitinophagaceae bacterium]